MVGEIEDETVRFVVFLFAGEDIYCSNRRFHDMMNGRLSRDIGMLYISEIVCHVPFHKFAGGNSIPLQGL